MKKRTRKSNRLKRRKYSIKGGRSAACSNLKNKAMSTFIVPTSLYNTYLREIINDKNLTTMKLIQNLQNRIQRMKATTPKGEKLFMENLLGYAINYNTRPVNQVISGFNKEHESSTLGTKNYLEAMLIDSCSDADDKKEDIINRLEDVYSKNPLKEGNPFLTAVKKSSLKPRILPRGQPKAVVRVNKDSGPYVNVKPRQYDPNNPFHTENNPFIGPEMIPANVVNPFKKSSPMSFKAPAAVPATTRRIPPPAPVGHPLYIPPPRKTVQPYKKKSNSSTRYENISKPPSGSPKPLILPRGEPKADLRANLYKDSGSYKNVDRPPPIIELQGRNKTLRAKVNSPKENKSEERDSPKGFFRNLFTRNKTEKNKTKYAPLKNSNSGNKTRRHSKETKNKKGVLDTLRELFGNKGKTLNQNSPVRLPGPPSRSASLKSASPGPASPGPASPGPASPDDFAALIAALDSVPKKELTPAELASFEAANAAFADIQSNLSRADQGTLAGLMDDDPFVSTGDFDEQQIDKQQVVEDLMGKVVALEELKEENPDANIDLRSLAEILNYLDALNVKKVKKDSLEGIRPRSKPVDPAFKKAKNSWEKANAPRVISDADPNLFTEILARRKKNSSSSSYSTVSTPSKGSLSLSSTLTPRSEKTLTPSRSSSNSSDSLGSDYTFPSSSQGSSSSHRSISSHKQAGRTLVSRLAKQTTDLG